jgi:dihydrofolate synthase/folylpolyglutamate synthase
VLELLEAYGFQISEKVMRSGLQATRWPGRLEYFVLDRKTGALLSDAALAKETPSQKAPDAVRFLLDGAHNPAGVHCLKEALQDFGTYNSLIGVFASMADKDTRNSLLPIAPLFERIILTRAESERSANPRDIKSMLPEKLQERAICIDSVHQAIAQAMEIAQPDDLVCVTGSLYLVGKARHILLGPLV